MLLSTLESVETVVGQQENLAKPDEADKTNTKDNVNKQRNDVQQGPTRRRSERLKKDTNLTTMEKTMKIVQEKNLEGNPKTSNSFAALSVDDISRISSKMGIAIDSNFFDTCNLLTDLEKARNDLYLKHLQ